ncbi:sugar transferase [Tropicimonas sp. TH_r6]|uniref:sugar transferase n=1 Tax=Tropicimonas sp. TH_r6 TaxID=3082085 RepID=UPI0029540EFB|nr:sugar transferase [Tropicimonas sp. TH_r6]MDV7141370.1 sugar transferase [Tropicimonas sp. TH_r6]
MSDLAEPLRATQNAPPGPSSRAVHLQGFKKIQTVPGVSQVVWVFVVNWVFTLLALPSLFAAGLLLLVLNPRYNPGPLIFRQKRVGRNERVFTIFKFRTMTVAPEDASTCFTANEARITRLGAVLRKFRIDELPNFVNVARGDMNVIGPRPDAKEQAEVYVNTVHGYRERFEVKPGITGLAQVVQGYAACEDSTRKKARYDRFYVRYHSAKLDAFVIVRTLQVMLTGFGSR